MNRPVLVLAEHRNGELREITHESISAATQVANDDAPVHVVLIAEEPSRLADGLDLDAVDVIHTFAHPVAFNHDVYVQCLAHVFQDSGAGVVIAGQTVNGLDVVPALAQQLDVPLLTDAIRFEQTAPELVVTREQYTSKVETSIAIERDTAVVSIRPGEWDPATEPGSPAHETIDMRIDTAAIRSTVLGFEVTSTGEIDLGDADVIVSVGRGIGEEEDLALIRELADVLDAAIGASRPIVDAGWLPKGRQVGQSGTSVAPDVYLAIGISGAVQHVAGIKDAETIVAINSDPDAPIFDIADIGIVGDLFEVVPALIDAVETGA